MIDLLRMFPKSRPGRRRGGKPRTDYYRVRGELLHAAEIASRAGISVTAVRKRARNGCPLDQLDAPAMPSSESARKAARAASAARRAWV